MGKLYIWGWWQGNNLGDNWIKLTLSKIFPYATFIDTSVTEFPNQDDFIICGGGGLFIYDVICPWYRTNRINEANLSFGMIGLGAEFKHKTDTANYLCKKSKFFYVRDQYSLDCMNINNHERSYDITFYHPLKKVELTDISLDKLFFVWRDGKDLISNELFEKYIQYGSSFEEWKNVASDNFKTITYDDFQTKDDDIDSRIADSGFVISGRYHGIVAAIQKGLPFVAIDICPKIRALLEEVGLDEYCIKISEIEKLDALIKKAKLNVELIRQKAQQYVETAKCCLEKQLISAKLEILKVIKPLNVIHYGSYWMKENDVVNTMSNDLARLCNLTKIDLHAYERNYDHRIKNYTKTPNGSLCLLDIDLLMKDITEHNAQVIILNSGGLYVDELSFSKLKKLNIVVVLISLSDPDVYPFNGKVYAEQSSLYYTNSKYSLLNQYTNLKNVSLLPFAASVEHHYFMPQVEKLYDVVIVGHARKEREIVVNELEKFCKVGCYGNGWSNSLGCVNGEAHTKAINSGKIYISFSKTLAGYNNVKVGLFEAMACNQFIITGYMEELSDYFEIGKEIVCYHNESEIPELVKYYLTHESEREKIRTAGYERFLKEHTYESRWNKVLLDIYSYNGDM